MIKKHMRNKILGILGGGQLGRMSALAAARLGVSVHIFTPEDNSPASQVSEHTVVADYTDKVALTEFANGVDVISYEFENIPAETITFLKTLKPVYPDEALLAASQDRIEEKTFLNNIGIDTTDWHPINSASDIENAFEQWNTDELIIKTTRFGYDGKGQARLSKNDDIQGVYNSFAGQPLIAERIIDFDCEISVIVARDIEGNIEIYGPSLNEHRNHILHQSTYPCSLDLTIIDKALEMGKTLAEKVELVGVLALELFVTKGGDVLANEIAPRTHNSGHWTIDACTTSQFENHVRAVCGFPLGSAQAHSGAVMTNLIGTEILQIGEIAEHPNTAIHDYGKNDIREGRKMGHFTVIKGLIG